MSDSERLGKPSPTPYDTTRQLVERFRGKTIGTPLGDLVSWFPDQTTQQDIAASNNDAKATFAAEALDNWVKWRDATRTLHIYRPQDGGTAAGDLGLTKEKAEKILPQVQELGRGLDNYMVSVIFDLLGGDLSLLATKLTRGSQVIGFNLVTLRESRMRRVDAGKNYHITFADGSPALDPLDALLYVGGNLPRDASIISPSYDAASETLSFQLPSPVTR